MNWITTTTTTTDGTVSVIEHASRLAARNHSSLERSRPGNVSSVVSKAIDTELSISVEVEDAPLILSGVMVSGDLDTFDTPSAEVELTTPHTPTVGILTAMDVAMTRIRELNPNVPTALAVIIASGSGKKHGHFEPSSWADTTGEHAGSGRHEILMSSESLARGAEPTLITLIHEAAHANAHAQGIKDTSRQGRFHNRKFRDTAESMGLIVEENSSIGHVTTGLTSQAQVDYAEVLDMLAAALTTHRKPAKTKKTKEKTTVKVGCDCCDDNGKQLTVTVPIKWYAEQRLQCTDCEEMLAPVN